VRADVDGVQGDASRGEQFSQRAVDGGDGLGAEISAGDAGLVGEHDQSEAERAHGSQTGEGVRQEFQAVRGTEVFLFDVDGAVAIEQHKPARGHAQIIIAGSGEGSGCCSICSTSQGPDLQSVPVQ